jgi:hypothetical protein
MSSNFLLNDSSDQSVADFGPTFQVMVNRAQVRTGS